MNPLLTFLLTFIIELIIYFIFIKEKKLEIIFYCFLINMFTWPLANVIYSIYGFFWLVETGVFIVEFLLISLMFKISWKRAVIISLITNLITAILSFLL
jgi:hypothetical protein